MSGGMNEHRLDDRDALTGLPGVDAVRERLRSWSEGGASTLHALLIGLRRFDAVNLAYGTATGDLALAEVAARLTHFSASELDGKWLAARAGGGTFLVVANQACSRERWQLYAEQLAEVIAGPIVRGTGSLRLSPRIALLRVLGGGWSGPMARRPGPEELRPSSRQTFWQRSTVTRSRCCTSRNTRSLVVN
jgi:diguanylate cyclase